MERDGKYGIGVAKMAATLLEPALDFDILQWTPDRYAAVAAEDAWLASKIFGKRFQLQRKTDPLGHPQFVVAVKE